MRRRSVAGGCRVLFSDNLVFSYQDRDEWVVSLSAALKWRFEGRYDLEGSEVLCLLIFFLQEREEEKKILLPRVRFPYAYKMNKMNVKCIVITVHICG